MRRERERESEDGSKKKERERERKREREIERERYIERESGEREHIMDIFVCAGLLCKWTLFLHQAARVEGKQMGTDL